MHVCVCMHAGLPVHVLCACVLNISRWSFILYCIVQQHWCSHYHTCLPQNCVFRNKNHQNPEHSIIFWNTSANVSPHLWKKIQLPDFMGKSQGILHCAPPIPILCSWERCLPIMFDCPPVQSFHNTTANFRVHASVTFSSTVAKDHFSWCTFLNIWKHLLFAGDGFGGVRSKDSAMFSIVCETFSQMAPWFQSTRLAASLKLQRNLFCFVSFVHAQSTSESKFALFLSFVHAQRVQKCLGKFWHKCFGYSREKSKRQFLLLLLFFKKVRIQTFREAIRISGTHYWFSWFSRKNSVEP